MKTKFPGYYSTPEESLSHIWSSESTLFVFDTNCLLNLYRCEEHTREDILNVMQAIANRIWIPFHVGLEYQKNRRTVINTSIESLQNIKEGLINMYTQNILEHGKVKRALYNKLSEDITSLQDSLKEQIDIFIECEIETRITSKQAISSHDSIRDAIDNIIGDKIGDMPTQEIIDKIDKEGELRYTKKIPPGFKDAAKKDITHHSGITFQDKFGDLYLWKELINKAEEENIKNVVLISDDTKDDWIFKYNNVTYGPLESLKTEICKNSNIDNFKLINQFTFLNDAKRFINNINVSDASLEEVEKLSLNEEVSESFFDYEDQISSLKSEKNNRLYLSKYNVYPTGQVNNIHNNELVMLRAHDQLKVFDVLAEETLSILNDLSSFDSYLSNKQPKNLHTERWEHLRELLYISKSLASKINNMLMYGGDMLELSSSTTQLANNCNLLEQGNAQANTYIHFSN